MLGSESVGGPKRPLEEQPVGQARVVNGVPSAEAPGLGLKGKGVSWTFVCCQGSLLALRLGGSFITVPLSSKESRAASRPSDVSFASGCWLGTAPRCKPLPAPCIFSGSMMRERRDSRTCLPGIWCHTPGPASGAGSSTCRGLRLRCFLRCRYWKDPAPRVTCGWPGCEDNGGSLCGWSLSVDFGVTPAG